MTKKGWLLLKDLRGDEVAINPSAVTDITTGPNNGEAVSIIWFGRGSVKVRGSVRDTVKVLQGV